MQENTHTHTEEACLGATVRNQYLNLCFWLLFIPPEPYQQNDNHILQTAYLLLTHT